MTFLAPVNKCKNMVIVLQTSVHGALDWRNLRLGERQGGATRIFSLACVIAKPDPTACLFPRCHFSWNWSHLQVTVQLPRGPDSSHLSMVHQKRPDLGSRIWGCLCLASCVTMDKVCCGFPICKRLLRSPSQSWCRAEMRKRLWKSWALEAASQILL